MKTVKDYSLKCICSVPDHEVCIGSWDDGQIVISIKYRGKWSEVVIEIKELQKVLKDIVDSNVSLTYSTKRLYTVGCVSIIENNIWVCINDTQGLFNMPDWIPIFAGTASVGILTEAGDFLVTEMNDFLVTE